MERIVFFDLDGTLLDRSKQVPASAVRAIWQLRENGVRVAIATGRAPFMFQHVAESLGIRDYVSFNGQYVESDGEVLYRQPIPTARLAAMEASASANKRPMVFMETTRMTANVQDHPWIVESIRELKVEPPPYEQEGYRQRDIYQALLYCTEDEQPLYEADFSDLDFIRWHRYSVDIVPGGGSKAVGIRKMCEHYGIAPEHVYAFGDAANDVEMLREAAVGVAMGDAAPEAVEAADWVTRTSEEDGIEWGLQKLGLI